ncbi:MAG: hypothetical protein FWG98_15425 [Candidatus Cloacimonetes bacterium]|nr:hypothetical protein [Candidatus Cloacimonadota bacterium]
MKTQIQREEFINSYKEIVKDALYLATINIKKGILGLSKVIDKQKVEKRDILHYGLHLLDSAVEKFIIRRILSNIIKQDNEEGSRELKIIQRKAVENIIDRIEPKVLLHLLNSFTDITIDSEHYKELENYLKEINCSF